MISFKSLAKRVIDRLSGFLAGPDPWEHLCGAMETFYKSDGIQRSTGPCHRLKGHRGPHNDGRYVYRDGKVIRLVKQR